MVDITSALENHKQTGKKHFKLIETTYRSNTSSDYTEKMEELAKNFDYHSNSDRYWSVPEQSLLYGTPLYDAASSTQRMALNHLHWFANYNYVADTETETLINNQSTASIFASLGGYETIAQELELETQQEYAHIHTFRKIGLTTAKTLMGRDTLKAMLKWHSYQLTLGQNSWATFQYYALRKLSQTMNKSKKQFYSRHLQEVEAKEGFIGQKRTTGVMGRNVPSSLQRFFLFNWGGGSPFLACEYYVLRMMSNLTLKNMEHPIFKYYKKQQKKGESIPEPTAVSHYHFLDESFHTTISQTLSRDMYKDFSPPTAYEKFVVNLAVYFIQSGTLAHLSGAFPHRYFQDDISLMELIYRLLQAPIFGMSEREALHWLEQCLCHEQESFHLAAKNHQSLLEEQRRFVGNLDYLWPINREMRAMASGGSIHKAIQNNIRTFKRFSRFCSQD
ncbi:hypothetical protein [Pleurocapsa sp. PCC 7319]|uniref:hypothetical protein n=1 Tax=Pleurocapsa sp. PCC 7319 TaxID=118161 RepID=UPI000346E812|nr:hypothetical protein [Pleurocapsa sp. PCC 7319]